MGGLRMNRKHNKEPHGAHMLLDVVLKSFSFMWRSALYITSVPGVNHDELVGHAEASFSSIPKGLGTTNVQSEYVGGTYCN